MNPSSVARSFLSALAAGRWTDAAKLVDPASRRSTHSSAIAHFVAWAQFRALPKVTGQQMTGYSSSGKVDPEILQAFGHTIIPTYRGRPTIHELAALSPLAFVERLLDSANTPFGILFRRLQDPYVLGHVMDGPNWAHVLIREGPPKPRSPRHDTDTLSLTRSRGTWRIQLSHTFAHVHLPMGEDDPFTAMAEKFQLDAG